MDPLYLFTGADVRTLRQLIDEHRNRPRTAPNRGRSEESLGAPVSVYVALTPSGGIPGLSPSSSGTGGFDSPTGVECAIYRLLDVDLVPINQHELIYNLSTTSISGGKYIRIVRDPWGTWYAEGITSSGVAFSGASVEVNSFTVANSTGTDVVYTTPTIDTDSYFSLGNPTRLTVPATGYYSAGAVVAWMQGGGIGTRAMTVTPVGFGGIAVTDARSDVAPFNITSATIGGLFRMTAGDHFIVRVVQDSGGPLDISVSRFWAYRVG